ncbi:MAG: DUF308 domain-containing protein [Ruminococcus sp.]|nr:DUF308 domain-containing protein [Ruminococcus sp.]
MKFVEKTRRFEVLLYVCCLAIGIWLLIMQKQALNIICWVLGIALIVYGVFVTIGFFTGSDDDDPEKASPSFELAKGVVFAVMGILVITSVWFIDILAIIIGILLVINGIVSLQKALYIRRTLGKNYNGWIVALINSIVTTVFGLVLIFISASDVIAILVGVGLTWYGLSSIVNYIAVVQKINKIVKQRKKGVNSNGSSAEVEVIEDKRSMKQ